MNAIRGFLANYSGNFQIALMLWPVISAMLTLPILAYLYHRDGRLRMGSVLTTYLAVLYLLGIGCFTLWPLPTGDEGLGITYGVAANFDPLAFVGDIAKDGWKAVFQLLFNMVLFLPLGFIAGRFLHMQLPSTLMLSLALSALIEIAQFTGLFGIYPYAYRCCDVDDLVTNVVGGMLGWLLASAFERVIPHRTETVKVTKHPGIVRRCVALWIDLMLVVLANSLFWLIVSLPFYLTGTELALPGVGAEQTQQWLTDAMFALLLLVVGVVIPWCNNGRTPGGSFVHMTCESRVRASGSRAAFYVVRLMTIALLLWIPWLMIPILGVFYLIKREMPCDLIP